MSDSLDQMYREVILDHYRSPRGHKPLDRSDVTSEGQNPSCGDEIEMKLKLNGHDEIEDVYCDCKGCAISVASASMMAELLKGRKLEDVEKIAQTVRRLLKGEDIEVPEDLGDVDALKGVRKFPVRIKCALLAWVTLLEGLKNYHNGNNGKAVATTEEPEG
jgi:SUF system NifU family Fe-S assembly protein